MPALEKAEKFNNSVIKRMEWVGLAALLVMMLITCFDVVGAKLFLHPVFGALDIVEISQLVAVSFAVGGALIHGRHVAVEFLVILLPERIRSCVAFVVQLLGLVLFVVIAWRLTQHAYYLQMANEVTGTARIPLFPFVYAAALASVPVCIVFLLDLIKSLYGMVKK